MRKFRMATVSAILAATVMFSSCIGSHALFHRVYDMNQNISGSKWLNEICYFAMWIIPVYEISLLGDVLIFNSVEFWTGNNPLAKGSKKMKGSDGKEYVIQTQKDGYTISQGKNSLDLKYNGEDQSWNVVAKGKSHKLLKMKDNGTADVYLNGKVMNVTLDAQGATAVREAAMGVALAAR